MNFHIFESYLAYEYIKNRINGTSKENSVKWAYAEAVKTCKRFNMPYDMLHDYSFLEAEQAYQNYLERIKA